MFSLTSSYGYYNYEVKKFTLQEAKQTFSRIASYKVDSSVLVSTVTKNKVKILSEVNLEGKVGKPDKLSEMFGDKMGYPKFWNNFIGHTEVDIKHQYLRMRINNTALLPNANTTGERSPFTDFVYWFLNRVNTHENEP
jgi:hypothetical protein